MEWMFIGIVVFLFLLAAFDLYVGVSNDAVNFLNSAIGSKAARFSRLVVIASVGVLIGCILSNGMMDIARHGIFSPQYFSFHDVMYIYLAVMVTDIVLLDIFNTFGMPTSTTVSMVFELLGASFAFVIIKMTGDATALGMADYLNTSKALEVIMGIFLSVPIAFVFGALVQWITRIVFSFNIKTKIRWKIGIYGGIALTAIVYFMLFKGLKDLSFMNADVKAFLNEHILTVLCACFVVFTILMQTLHFMKVNVLRVIVLVGTFALSTAFAGNDLVNFIGVPLAGFSAFLDYSSNGAGVSANNFMMSSLEGSASTPIYFLIAAGAIMVFALATSKKARHVTETEVGLSKKDEGDEMFGSSRAARSLVRWGNSVGHFLTNYTPAPIRTFIDNRFRIPQEAKESDAAYDLLRASVNLVMASLLIALGTSLKLPLSTTFVTFMVAMGSSLADRAWSRESAVFRITGVLTVIGGWFLTAGVAFSACFFVALLMNYGGVPAAAIIVCLGLYSIIHSQRKYSKKKKEEEKNGDVLFNEIITCAKPQDVPMMLNKHLDVSTGEMLSLFANAFKETTEGLFVENLRALKHASKNLSTNKRTLKNLRRRETICLRHADPPTAIKLSTTFHLAHNSMRQILYGLIRINEPAKEHVDNHFTPIDRLETEQFSKISKQLTNIIMQAAENLREQRIEDNETLREECEMIRGKFNELRDIVLVKIQRPDINITSETLLLHIIQESEQLCIEIRQLLKLTKRFKDSL